MAEGTEEQVTKTQILQKAQSKIMQEENRRARCAADAVWDLYEAGKVQPEIAAICEKFLVGYWDSEAVIKVSSKKTKKKAGAKAKVAPSS